MITITGSDCKEYTYLIEQNISDKSIKYLINQQFHSQMNLMLDYNRETMKKHLQISTQNKFFVDLKTSLKEINRFQVNLLDLHD